VKLGLVLSLFPGIGLLDMAFEAEGFCVVRGPDLLWGGDIRGFHPPAGKFDGVIGGPPCQEFSALAPLVRHNGHEPRFGNLIPEYERCVAEAQPAWFVMENVRGAPLPEVEGYDRWAELLKDSDVGGVQPRVRRISWGMREGAWTSISSPFSLVEYDPSGGTEQSVVRDGRAVPVKVGGSGKPKRTITSTGAQGFGGTRRDPDSGRPGRRSVESEALRDSGYADESDPQYQEALTAAKKRKTSVKSDPRPMRREARSLTAQSVEGSRDGHRLDTGDMLEAQGLPRDYLDDAPFTVQGKRSAIGNGVPLPMGRAIARAVKWALGHELTEAAGGA
jgi:DNA (cytosine-5)-methyltransferase 1